MRRVFVVLAALCALAGCGEGEDDAWQDELGTASAQVVSYSAYMGCYIDTPALDEYTIGNCIEYGIRPSIAAFRLFTSTPAARVVWYGHSECTGVECAVPISPGQRITLNAYYVTLDGRIVQGQPATARYPR